MKEFIRGHKSEPARHSVDISANCVKIKAKLWIVLGMVPANSCLAVNTSRQVLKCSVN